jgi:hypothetical protein
MTSTVVAVEILLQSETLLICWTVHNVTPIGSIMSFHMFTVKFHRHKFKMKRQLKDVLLKHEIFYESFSTNAAGLRTC